MCNFSNLLIYSYKYKDGTLLLVKVAEISVNGTTVEITEDSNAELKDYFDYVKIDKDFFWHLMRKESGRQLMDALVTFLSRNHHNVIIEGVESEAHKEWLQGMEWFAIQGHYWREVSIEQLVADDIAM